MNELEQIRQSLPPEVVAWFWKITSWMGIARLLAKPVSGWAQGLMTKLATFNTSFAYRLTQLTSYQVIAFFCDYSSSVKLPTKESLKAMLEKTNQPTN